MRKSSLNKKTLIISTWAPPMVGGPQNLFNLFSQYSKNSYCILTSFAAMRQGRSSGSALPAEYFFHDHKGTLIGGTLAKSHLPNTRSRIGASYGNLTSKLPAPAKYVLETVVSACYSILTIARMTRRGIRIVRDRNIECLVGISDNGPAMISTYLVSRCTGVPYALYLFDIYLGNILLPVHELLARIFEHVLFRRAAVVILTNQGTQRFYHKRYGDSFRSIVVPNSAFIKDYRSQRTSYNPREPFSILFTGNVYWAQERSLLNLVRAMDDVRDLPARLDLYVPDATETLIEAVQNRSNINLTAAPQSAMPRIQSRATLLFLPLSWHTSYPSVIATATPGKLTDYMAAGRPILIHAPPYAYVNEYAKKHGLALVVEEESVEKLNDAMRRLLLDLKYSRRIVSNARRTFRKHHEAVANARKLASVLNDIAMRH